MGAKIVLGADRVDVQIESVLVDLDKGHILDLAKALPTRDQHWIWVMLDKHLTGTQYEA